MSTYIKGQIEEVNCDVGVIIQKQKEWIGYYTMPDDQKKATKLLNNDLLVNFNKNTDGEKQAIMSAVKEIEKKFHGLQKGALYTTKKNQIFTFKERLIQLINNYQILTNNLKGSSNPQVIKNVNLLEEHVDRLWAELELFSSYSDLSKATFYDYNESKKDKRNKSILRSLAGIGSFLKGLELEVRIVDWFNSKIDKKGIKTVQTGGIKYVVDLTGKTVDIKEDLAIFDLASEIEIEIGGKNYTIAELTEISEKETIIISENDYKKLQSAMLFAVSAKAGTSDRVNLHSGLSIEKILNDIDKNYIEKSYYYPLYNYYKYEAQMKTEKLEFYVNYNMSKILNKIIGEKNFFFITQNGFITTAELINNITTAKDYIKVNKASYKDMNVIAAHKYFIPKQI